MKGYLVVTLVAILSIVGLEAYALYLGVNGLILSGVIAVIGGLGGYGTKAYRDKRKTTNNKS